MSHELAFYDREDHPWRNPLLERTAIIGHTTTDTCKVWVRVRGAGKYKVVCSTDEKDISPLTPGTVDVLESSLDIRRY